MSEHHGGHDDDQLPAIPTPETDARLRIPEVLDRPPAPPKKPPTGGSGTDMSGMGRAWAMGFDVVAMSLGGIGLGWLVDYWLHSSPIGILVGLAGGFGSAMVRIVRTMNRDEG